MCKKSVTMKTIVQDEYGGFMQLNFQKMNDGELLFSLYGCACNCEFVKIIIDVL